MNYRNGRYGAYITPAMEVTEIAAAAMLAASIRIDRSDEGGDEQLSNERRGTWGDLWE